MKRRELLGVLLLGGTAWGAPVRVVMLKPGHQPMVRPGQMVHIAARIEPEPASALAVVRCVRTGQIYRMPLVKRDGVWSSASRTLPAEGMYDLKIDVTRGGRTYRMEGQLFWVEPPKVLR